jgi:hypothetical protein
MGCSACSGLGHFETQEVMPTRVPCWSLAPLAADTRPECVSLKSVVGEPDSAQASEPRVNTANLAMKTRR